MALSVMSYHYYSWIFGDIGSEYLLGKLGMYAVAIFYVLSGLSLTIVYQNKVSSRSDVLSFFIKRFFRIFPLFWLATTCMLSFRIGNCYLHDLSLKYSIYEILLNYSLLFGFVKPTVYIPIGGWSIGNEMVFYAVFPFIFLMSRRWKLIIPVLTFVSIAIGLYWAFFLINPNVIVSDQWALYVNPFNQLYFFMAGVLIGAYEESLRRVLSKPICYSMLALAIIIFWLYPVSGDQVQIATGVSRVILSACSISIVLFVFLLSPKLNRFFSIPLAFLGEGCYSIYLLHALVPWPILFVLYRLNVVHYAIVSYSISFFLTFIVIWFTFNYLEKPTMKIGQDVSQWVKAGKIKVKGDEKLS